MAPTVRPSCNRARRQGRLQEALYPGGRKSESVAGPQSQVPGEAARGRWSCLARNRPPEPQPGVFLYSGEKLRFSPGYLVFEGRSGRRRKRGFAAAALGLLAGHPFASRRANGLEVGFLEQADSAADRSE